MVKVFSDRFNWAKILKILILHNSCITPFSSDHLCQVQFDILCNCIQKRKWLTTTVHFWETPKQLDRDSRVYCPHTVTCQLRFMLIWFNWAKFIEVLKLHDRALHPSAQIAYVKYSLTPWATVFKNASGLRPQPTCGRRQGGSVEMVWSSALIQWPANCALCWA